MVFIRRLIFVISVLWTEWMVATLSSELSQPTVYVKLVRTTTSTVYSTTTDLKLTGTFVASYNIVEIINRKGMLPSFHMTAYSQLETYSDTWTTPSTITTTTTITVGTRN